MCTCVCVRTCIYVRICMCVCICICMRLYTCVCVWICIFVHRLWVSVSVLRRVDGVMHAHVYSWRMHMCVIYIYMCIFCSECCMHFETGVLGTSAWSGVYVTQVCFLHQRTHLRTHSLQVVHKCVYVYMCVYAWYMDAYVRLWYCLTRWGVVTKNFYLCIRVHMHAYVHVCACMRV